jgi:hypothetical protein
MPGLQNKGHFQKGRSPVDFKSSLYLISLPHSYSSFFALVMKPKSHDCPTCHKFGECYGSNQELRSKTQWPFLVFGHLKFKLFQNMGYSNNQCKRSSEDSILQKRACTFEERQNLSKTHMSLKI